MADRVKAAWARYSRPNSRLPDLRGVIVETGGLCLMLPAHLEREFFEAAEGPSGEYGRPDDPNVYVVTPKPKPKPKPKPRTRKAKPNGG
tara:strand:- start:86 stop:352 length:267 start_codon:yes stop_codon:yes gene_type:complete